MSTDKTLADVQPGGRVRLGGCNSLAERITDHLCNNEYDIGGRAELLSCVSEAIAADARERFEAWARLRGHTLTRAADGEYCFISVRNLWTQWQAALSAQPSPGGQDVLFIEELAELRRLVPSVNQKQALDAAIAALAARQPVGEPVAVEVPQGAIINGAAFADRLEHDYQFECPAGPLANCTDYVEFRRCFDFLAQWASSLPPLYAAPTAQAVDLEQFHALAEFGEEFAFSAEKQPQSRVIYAQARRLLALIDRKADGNG